MVILTFTIIFVESCLISALKGAPAESSPSLNVSKTVFGGSPAKLGDFPYQVYIAYGDRMCGGSIYDATTIITAAHCNFYPNKQRAAVNDYAIYAGSTEPSRGQRRLARYTVVHENYNANSYGSDIAIIGLAEPLNFDRNVQPIALAPPELTFPPGTSCYLSGFGSVTNRNGRTGNLRYATINIKKDTDCAKHYDGDQWNAVSMVCAGGDGTNSCAGDSGGPLVCRYRGLWYHYGAVSMGPNECGTRGFPSTYSKIPYYNAWIRENIHA